ncbi:DNA-binding transcriptional LysR family regulator [Saccharopolyspora erythraea NRRL 2338]|uniref:LysR-family transcriptional regulator n=2 Tax=Saccharopolyspora erythraea TaxID=1836 RepID=A4F8I8_SACEN|nr:LysR family transcriptional regulator [Saccharopolyspora erythraea]EQD85114.1 LysR family transcriptional regulator [Saccharopolyspora erythraea D]PFG94157.1 DNA-binding transcriptional LysR family regulator [Saccharopolyspora erythraea NRRL 2338]QRK90945.1 LysR family transcriptional regulator [Saccharopolyspora erythraea]CAM00363.1 LysR-family transcriptional regulator [Saccharopolyspora erythraea NRRL 2338]
MTYETALSEDASQLAAHLSPTLALLRAVASEGHLTRAAEQLGIPQPTASRTLARLSDEIGAPVIAPHGRGIRLTRTGRLLASAATDALRSLEAGCREVVEEISPERGQVVLGFQHTMGGTLVPALIRGFRADHPQVRFGLAQGARVDMLAGMLDGRIDFCLISPPPDPDPALEWVPLRAEPLLAVLHTGHRLAGRAALALSELADDDFVVTRHGYGLRQIFTELSDRAGFAPRVAFESEEVDTARGLVAAGLGVALLPPAVPEAVPGTVEIPLDPAEHRTICLTWPAHRALPPAVRAFRDFASHRGLD